MIFIYHTSRSTSRQLQRLGLVSDAKRLVSVSELCVSGLVAVSSRTKCPTSRSRLGLGLKGLVHIPVAHCKSSAKRLQIATLAISIGTAVLFCHVKLSATVDMALIMDHSSYMQRSYDMHAL